jgi:predicted nucleic-acid-binding Zn-ribbon protein
VTFSPNSTNPRIVDSLARGAQAPVIRPDEASLKLLERAQSGDIVAVNKYLAMIRDNHMPKRIKHYIKRNVLVEQVEIESEYMLGCYEAMSIAKLDVGNPLDFILWKGGLKVAHLFKKRVREGVTVHCKTCGITSMGYKNKTVLCGKCGSNEITTQMIMVGDSQLTDVEIQNGTTAYDRAQAQDPFGELDAIFGLATEEIMIAEIQKKLSGRVLELFNIMIVEQVNRTTSDNYLQEIADRWGITTACVSIYLRKLRLAIVRHLGDDDEA